MKPFFCGTDIIVRVYVVLTYVFVSVFDIDIFITILISVVLLFL